MSNVKRIFTASLHGWVMLAGVLMIIVGFFETIAGLVAIFRPDLYVATEDSLFLLNYTQWGWTHLIIGLILIGSAISLFMGKLWGRIMAVMLASLSIILNFGFIWAYPVWSIMVIVIDILIIYAVTVFSDEPDGVNA